MRNLVWVVLLATAALSSACRRTYTYAVVPRPNGGYRPDTLRAFQNGNQVFVIFRFDTITHTRTLYKTDTLWREGTRVIRDTLRLVRRDTIRVFRRDTLRIVRRDTIKVTRTDTVKVGGEITRVDTVKRYDTVVVERPGPVRFDTVVVTRPGPVRVDTLRRVDTVIFTRQGPVRVDTVRIAGGSKRVLFVPPGQYPPAGQCRVWIHDRPPGQQRDAAPCDALGAIPAGAFILFGGEAWDFDYDWLSDAGGAPPQIIALKKKRP